MMTLNRWKNHLSKHPHIPWCVPLLFWTYLVFFTLIIIFRVYIFTVITFLNFTLSVITKVYECLSSSSVESWSASIILNLLFYNLFLLRVLRLSLLVFQGLFFWFFFSFTFSRNVLLVHIYGILQDNLSPSPPHLLQDLTYAFWKLCLDFREIWYTCSPGLESISNLIDWNVTASNALEISKNNFKSNQLVMNHFITIIHKITIIILNYSG
jgi:hypothetical protein